MYAIFAYIGVVSGVNVGKYDVHGVSGNGTGIVIGRVDWVPAIVASNKIDQFEYGVFMYVTFPENMESQQQRLKRPTIQTHPLDWHIQTHWGG